MALGNNHHGRHRRTVKPPDPEDALSLDALSQVVGGGAPSPNPNELSQNELPEQQTMAAAAAAQGGGITSPQSTHGDAHQPDGHIPLGNFEGGGAPIIEPPLPPVGHAVTQIAGALGTHT